MVATLTRPFLNGQANAIVLHSFFCVVLTLLPKYVDYVLKLSNENSVFLILFSTDVF